MSERLEAGVGCLERVGRGDVAELLGGREPAAVEELLPTRERQRGVRHGEVQA